MRRRICQLALGFGLAMASACAPATAKLTVVGLGQGRDTGVVYVRVVNTADLPMRLTELRYTIGATAGGPSIRRDGVLSLSREIAPGGVAVVSVPVDDLATIPPRALLRGRLIAHIAEIQQEFTVATPLTPQTTDPLLTP